MTTAAWLVMAVSGARQHAGNDGYDDDPATSYQWDDTVPNHAKIKQGDRIVLWDKTHLLGASVVDHVDTASDRKTVHRCPKCKKSGIKARKRRRPAFHCYECKYEFDDPQHHRVEVTTFRSQHGAAWIELAGLLSGAELRPLCESPRSQLSLRPLRWEAFAALVNERRAGEPLGLIDAVDRRTSEGHTIRSVKARVGQGPFRKQLLEQFEDQCAFTGLAPQQVLQACHLYSYAAEGRHHDQGGLLLRSDLHTLFDLGKIAVDPATKRLDLDDTLRSFPEYWQLHGRPLSVPVSAGHIRWLKVHWELHRA